MAKPMFESDPWNAKESSSSQIKYEDEDNSGSVFQSDFNPDDLERSTSAPPVLELASESLFAFNTDGFEPAGNYIGFIGSKSRIFIKFKPQIIYPSLNWL